jgi:hypothetical protein
MAEKTQAQPRKRGVRGAVVALLAAALIIAPSYLAGIMESQLKIDISIVAVMSLAIFLVGVFLLVRLLKD